MLRMVRHPPLVLCHFIKPKVTEWFWFVFKIAMHSAFICNDVGCSSCQRLMYNAMLIGCTVDTLGIMPSLLGLDILAKFNLVDKLITSGSK